MKQRVVGSTAACGLYKTASDAKMPFHKFMELNVGNTSLQVCYVEEGNNILSCYPLNFISTVRLIRNVSLPIMEIKKLKNNKSIKQNTSSSIYKPR
jgi:hypothetical protein